MSLRLALGIAALGVFMTTPRAAEPVRDAESGLAVVPPDGYVAEILGPEYRWPGSVQISVRKPEDGIGVTGCKVIFSLFRFRQVRPYRDGATQEEVNAQFTRPGGTADSLLYLLGGNSLGNVEHIQHDGVHGIRHVYYSNPQVDGRVWWTAYLDKPQGRISVSCGALAASFDARRREFEAVLDGTTLPR
jgi:hypothetical protein